jgi:lipopolysaccharide export system protein LptA
MSGRLVLGTIATLATLCAASAAYAERSDRDQPVNIEADRITVDEAQKVQTFEGNVRLVQGTLEIRAEKLVVTQDGNGFQKGVALGAGAKLASFRQKREGKNEYIEGAAARIEHDAKTEKTELFNNAFIKSGLDEVHGQFISYDARSENYVVSGTAPGTAQTGAPGRVRAVIQPKNRGE